MKINDLATVGAIGFLLAPFMGAVGGRVDAGPPSTSLSKGSASSQHIQVSLVGEHDAITPGSTTTIAVVLDIEPGWYTYWKNPGDTGFEMSVRFEELPGLTFSEPIWPAPKRKVLPGGILDYVYMGRVALLFEVEADSTLVQGSSVEIRAKASWLVCQQVCFPEKAQIGLTLPVRDSRGAGAGAPVIGATRAGLPRRVEATDGIRAEMKGQTLEVRAEGAKSLAFYPDYHEDTEPLDIITDGEAIGEALDIRFENLGKARAITGVLAVERDSKITYHLIRAPLDG